MRGAAYAGLAAIGLAWGASAPIIKTATGAGYAPLTVIFWRSLLNVLVLGAILAATGGLRRMPRTRPALAYYLVVGLFGMSLPHWASFSATAHLPAGVMALVISLVPIFALPIALVRGHERFDPWRALGVGLGGLSMALLIAPSTSLPAPGLWVWVLVGALAPFLYALEGTFVASLKTPPIDPFAALWAGAVVSVVVIAPLAWGAGQLVLPMALGPVEGMVALSQGLSVLAYAGYLRLIRATGPVFAAQVSYAVTAAGIGWSMLFLQERYSAWVWAAMALVFVALTVVQPRQGAKTGPSAGDPPIVT